MAAVETFFPWSAAIPPQTAPQPHFDRPMMPETAPMGSFTVPAVTTGAKS